MQGLFSGVFGTILWVAGAVTYIINLIETWSGDASVWMKILISVTLDWFLAAIWPIMWIIWIIMHLAGKATPLSTVFGL